MKKRDFKKTSHWAILKIGVILFFTIISSLVFTRVVYGMSIMVESEGIDALLEEIYTQDETQFETEEQRIAREKSEQKLGSKLFHSVLGGALNTIAYDTATWLGSGGEGQEPLFITEGWEEYLTNVADNAAGEFLEILGTDGPIKFNLCNPDFSVTMKIGLALYQYQRPRAPACTFTEMKRNWEAELEDPNFLNKLQDMFEPTSNDLGIALSLHTGLIATQNTKVTAMYNDRAVSRGWLDVRNIAGYLEGPPGLAEKELDDITEPQKESLGKWTGDIVVDAANIFLNQLAITALNTLIKSLAEDTDPYTSPYDYSDSMFSYEAGATNYGLSGAEEKFRSFLEPDFNVRGDYDILTELGSCPDPNEAGPTNCVLNDRFRQAIEQKLTVREAVDQGYISASLVFGFSANGIEPSYIEGYPYRIIKILRKFRVLPVGWELAAQYINENSGNTDGTKNLEDLLACYSDTDDWTGYYAAWCESLVDPEWVLKAPLNYCKKEGPGPEIISSTVSGEDEDSELNISRDENYCADEQACIKEYADGSCKLYGYCTKERRAWNFDSDSCEPVYNTCQTFRVRGGSSISYLENTLDYGICSSDNVGCLSYCEDYDGTNFTCDLTTGSKIYLDADVKKCDSEAEGCHEFIRVKSGVGANFLRNSSFESIAATDAVDDSINDSFEDWTVTGEAVSAGSNSYYGAIGLRLGAALSRTIDVGPIDLQLAGESYTLSFYAKNCLDTDTFSIDVNTTIGISSATGSLASDVNWQYYSVTHLLPLNAIGNILDINIYSSDCIIDAIKFERNNFPTQHSYYREQGLVYQRLAPFYLGCSASGGPAECDNYIRYCSASEVGCDLFTAVFDGITVPAKVLPPDYCPAECVGYDEYIQPETIFSNVRADYFIPKSSRRCSAQAVGCDEFTNLDKLGEGAEEKEYYKELRQCNPDVNDPACQEYYTWEGSNETGYQLRVHYLQTAVSGPELTNSGLYNGLACASISDYDLKNNPMCWEFFDTSGQEYYRFYPYVITCSTDCHPFRRTENNIVKNLDGTDLTSVECSALSVFSGDTYYSGSECYFCKNRGVWDSAQSACIYDAIPDEGVKCGASAAGCREYRGSAGNNMRIVFTHDFEGNTYGWSGALSSNALMIGGESLLVTGSADYNIGQQVSAGRTYILRFIAAAATPGVNLTARLDNPITGSSTLFSGTASLSDANWIQFDLDLLEMDYEPTSDVYLVIDAGADPFYIDDIRLIEITDRYYLIKDSWQTPVACYEDIFGNYMGLTYNAGCEEYRDRENSTHYLRSFSNLCDETSVGCEVMLDTQNYSDYRLEAWNDGGDDDCTSDGEDCELISADTFVYAVYDSSKACNSTDLGCQLVGEPYQVGTEVVYSGIYLRNNPNNYNNILCQLAAEGCEQWGVEDGTDFFKDPGSQVCEWRQSQDATSTWDWYKAQVDRCDDNDDGDINVSGSGPSSYSPLETTICLDDSQCPASINCIQDTNDYACTTYGLKTVGYGGPGNVVIQPDVDVDGNWWAGLCSAGESGCSEFIDPVSRFNPNMVKNPTFLDVNIDGVADSWSGGNQSVDLDIYTMYRLAGKSMSGDLTMACTWPIYIIDSLNDLQSSGLSVTILASGTDWNSVQFYSGANNSCAVTPVSPLTGEVEIRKLAVDYQLAQNVNKTSCNGTVDFEDGCVLFNQRSQEGFSLNSLVWDADLTIADSFGVSPIVGATGENDSNTLIKVRPDRVCHEWLACRSFVLDEDDDSVCFDITHCDSVDDNGRCDNFLPTTAVSQTYTGLSDAPAFADLSGYNRVGYFPNSEGSDMFPLGTMAQEGEVVYLINGGFESYGVNDYPLGWSLENINMPWESEYFKVIDNPVEAQNEGIEYAPEGKAFVKVGPAYPVVSDPVEVAPGSIYIISAVMNTMNLALNEVTPTNSDAKIVVTKYDSGNNAIGSTLTLSQEPGHGWEYQSGIFDTGNTGNPVVKIEIKLETSGSGNFYVDDIKLRPALYTRPAQYVPQTCRLYPETDSLACDYFEDSGMRIKGWWGYCLEYDRNPGSSDACLMWWPVDRVKGDGVDNEELYSGYQDKYPLYYCGNIEADFQLVEKRKQVLLSYMKSSGWTALGYFVGGLLNGIPGLIPLLDPNTTNWEGMANICPAEPDITNGGYTVTSVTKKKSGLFSSKTETWIYCTPIASDLVVGEWYTYNGNLVKFSGLASGGWNETTDGVKIYDPAIASAPFDPKDYNIPCTNVWQTVNISGQNKSWNGRVYTASEYYVNQLNYAYATDDAPFGSAVAPEPESNPYEWDSSDLAGLQPLYLLAEDDDNVRAGSPYLCNGSECGNLGLCDISLTVCLDVPVSNPRGVINDCGLVNTAPCYVNWSQTFLECPSGERCNPDLFDVDLASPPPNVEEKLKRLFARSYGYWEWLKDEGECQGGVNQGLLCDYEGNQCPNGNCQANCAMYFAGGESITMYRIYDDTDSLGRSILTGSRTCATPADSCSDITFSGMTASALNAANTCLTFAAVCGASGALCPPIFCCSTVLNDYGGLGCTGVDLSPVDGLDDGNPECCLTQAEQDTCINYWTVTMPASSPDVCAYTGDTCLAASDCQFTTSCEYEWCSGGDYDGSSCNAEHLCPLSYCVLQTTAAGRYTYDPSQYWEPPEYLCRSGAYPGEKRPAWDNDQCNSGDCFDCNTYTSAPGVTCDVCGVLPQIQNITVGGLPSLAASYPLVDGSDYLELTFNSVIDQNQLPLVMYQIDWGDGEDTSVSGVEMYDRPDSNNPHSIYHLYSYWDMATKEGSGVLPGTAIPPAGTCLTDCSAYGVYGACCLARPGIKIKDNWGWCNNGIDLSRCPNPSDGSDFVYYLGLVVVGEDD